jgi:hypothetical protein
MPGEAACVQLLGPVRLERDANDAAPNARAQQGQHTMTHTRCG